MINLLCPQISHIVTTLLLDKVKNMIGIFQNGYKTCRLNLTLFIVLIANNESICAIGQQI